MQGWGSKGVSASYYPDARSTVPLENRYRARCFISSSSARRHPRGRGDASGKKAPRRLGRHLAGGTAEVDSPRAAASGPKPLPRHTGEEGGTAPGHARRVPAPLPGRVSPSLPAAAEALQRLPEGIRGEGARGDQR